MSGTGSVHPPCRPLPQETVRKWEKAAQETYICNQAAGFNCCVTKLQDEIQENIRILQKELAKGKGSQAAKKAVTLRTCVHLTITFREINTTHDGFTVYYHVTLMRRDAYLDHLKPDVKQDNWCALVLHSTHMAFFADNAL